MLDIAQRFFRFDRFIAATPIGSGHINDTYRLELEQSGQLVAVVLQRLNHSVFVQPKKVMDNTLRVCQYLAAQDYAYQVASPIPALDGTFLQIDASGNYWRIFEWIPNTYTPVGSSNPDIAYEAARAYGAFARALSAFPVETLAETIPGFHDTDRRWQDFIAVLEANPVQRSAAAKAEIEAMFAAKPVFDQISNLKKSGHLPQRVAHNDTKAGNVLFDKDTHKALAVIDLDTVMPGTLLSDFGDMVRTFVPHCSEDDTEAPMLRLDVLEALKSGFLEETKGFLSPVEKENLLLGAAWMAGEQALRFLTDWLAGDVYYKTNSARHNLLRAQNQLLVFEKLAG